MSPKRHILCVKSALHKVYGNFTTLFVNVYFHMLDHNNWKINFFEIDFVVPKKRRRTVTSNNAADADEDGSSSLESCLGRWNSHEVVTRLLRFSQVFDVDRKVKRTLMHMREAVGHENVARFFGISFHNDLIYLVEQYCANGTLVEFFRDNKYSVNQSFRYVACADIANGMTYLHRQNLIHGNLSIDKCHVDSRWTIKIVDWEYTALYEVVRRIDRNQARATRDKSVLHYLRGEGTAAFRHLAPEIHKDGRLFEPTRTGDVYSFGVIIRDMFMILPGQELPLANVEVDDTMPAKARQIMELACDETVVNRPNFEQMEKSLRSAINNRQTNLMDRYVHQQTLRLSFGKILVDSGGWACRHWVVNA